MKRRVKQLFKVIRDAEAELKEIREKCPHKKTHEGNWSSGPGRITHANICSDCGLYVSATGKLPDLPKMNDGGWKQVPTISHQPFDWFEPPPASEQ